MKLKKISFATVLLIAILAVAPVVAFAQTSTFRDVPPTHFAYEAVNWVSDPANGAFMVGNAESNFQPGRHLNKFEAAQVFAMAAGFRHVTDNLPTAEREVFSRSFDTWRPFLDTMANEYSTWNRTVDREIAFLLYRQILTTYDVETFVTRTGNEETRPLITREEAIVWVIRLMGQAPYVPSAAPQNLFSDDSSITAALRPYVYHARELGLFQVTDGNFNPQAHFTRAEMAVVFFNALAEDEEEAATATAAAAGTPTTITGTISNVFLDTHVSIVMATGTQSFAIAPNVVIMVDNVHRSAAFLREGMTVMGLVDANRQIINLVARSEEPEEEAPIAAPPRPEGLSLYSDEGFITGITAQNITIRIQRVRISGQVIDEERTFTFAPSLTVTHGGEPADLDEIQPGDIAFFNFNGTIIYDLDLMLRERTIEGILIEARPPENVGGIPVLVIEESYGRTYELRAFPATEFTRGTTANLNWYDLRIGDAITADVEFDRLVKVEATGERATVYGRLNEIRITERNTEVTITNQDGTISSYFIRPGVLEVYNLRIGMQIRISLDSREVMYIQPQEGTSPAYLLGFIQTVRNDGTIVVVEGQGATARTHTITLNNNTLITRGGAVLAPSELRVNMNVYILQTAAQSNVARYITILP